MAIIQIPNLPGVSSLSGEELFEGVQAGSSVKITLNQMIAAARGGTPATIPIPVSLGGTGLDTFAVGDIMYASATQTLSKLADVATGNAIISGGVGAAPSYGKIGLTTHVSGVLPVANGGTNQSAALTQYGVIYGNTTTSMASSAAGTSTQLLHGNAAGAPTWSAVSLTADVSGTLPVANGGTNITSYTIGDLIAASASGVLSPIADIATGNALLSGGVGVLPAYGKVTLTGHVSGILPVANGGTNISSYAIGDLIYASTTGVLSKLADVATGNALISGGVGVAPSYGKIGLTTHVSGTLPVANGGTNITSYAVGDILYASTTGVLSPLADVATGNAIISGGVGVAPTYGKIGLTTHVSGTLGVGNGGTGQASNLTQYGVVYGSTTTAMATSAAGTATQVLHGNAAGAPTWSAVSLTADVSGTLPVLNGGTGVTTSTGSGSVVLGTGPTITSGVYSGTVGASSPSTGAFTTVTASTSVLSTGAGGIGYATGAGVAVTQLTSRTTAAPTTGAKTTGAVTLFTTTAVVGTYFSFTVPNTAIAVTDTVVLSVRGATNTYVAFVSAITAATSFQVTMASVVGIASDTPIVNFAIIKGVSA